MTGYFLAGIFATAGIFILLGLVRTERDRRVFKTDYEVRIAKLEADKAVLLATALEARGAQLIDPAQGPRMKQVAQQAARANIEAGLARLTKESEVQAMDRDARVALEMEEARRAANDTLEYMKAQATH